MGDKRIGFLGTPLNRKLSEGDCDREDDTRIARRSRLDRLQMVKDDQGRRRFHGAFTGGFTAGYYGTVGTSEGFRTKSFISHRNEKYKTGQGAKNKFQHRPEDYMDEEDFNEFGIAPKKIRINAEYLQEHSINKNNRGFENLLGIQNSSVGERILNQMTGGKSSTRCSADLVFEVKNDYHGLGYQGLARARDISDSLRFDPKLRLTDPVTAFLDKGKKLQISGEAFGEGVLADDDDQAILIDEYGSDHIANYKFSSGSFKRSNSSTAVRENAHRNRITISGMQIDGFVLERHSNTQKACDSNERILYSLPNVPSEWSSPRRQVPYEAPRESSNQSEHELEEFQRQLKDSNRFGEKFTSGLSFDSLRPTRNSLQSGLLSFTDLKAQESALGRRDLAEGSEECYQSPRVERKVSDWRPCSLLCKHFDVPNPYPENAPSCSRLYNSFEECATGIEPKITDKGSSNVAPIELRRSVFNMTLFDDIPVTLSSRNSDEEEDCSPQIVTNDEIVLSRNRSKEKSSDLSQSIKTDSDQDSEILVCDVSKPEPELIVLSSSPSDTTPEKTSPVAHDDDDQDSYGPPLPPFYSALNTIEREKVNALSQSRHRKKHKKRK